MLGSLGGQEKNRAAGHGAGLGVKMRTGNSPHKTEGDAEVILANAVIATILLKGKLPETEYEENERKL